MASEMTAGGGPLLLMDTCGERATVALVLAPGEVREAALPARGASAHLLSHLRALLQEAGVALRDVGGIGVVSGPGSFTGVRVGMAVAKGLSLASGVPLAAVSRLAVLAAAAELQEGFAVLGAGREDVYVREVTPGEMPKERMMRAAELLELAGGRAMVCAGGEALPAGLLCREVVLSAASALGLVVQELREAAVGVAGSGADANYVRDEQGIYRARVGLARNAG